jgi:hypothetical protein
MRGSMTGVAMFCVALGISGAGSAFAAGSVVQYTGQGFDFDGTTYTLKDERCGLEGEKIADDGNTGQFADWNGSGQAYETCQGYLVWVLSANRATSAKLHLPDQSNVDMVKVGGTFKYASKYYSHEELTTYPVSATYQGRASGGVQLVVSHGCQPYEQDISAWCGSGFWKNASDAAWMLTGLGASAAEIKSLLFNDYVVPSFYDTAFTSEALPSGPTLEQALDNGGAGGANKYGAESDPYDLNAFNATGAFLTDRLTGYAFDPELIGDETACPIDKQGTFKE